MPDLGEKFPNDLPELFLRNLLFDVFVRAVEIRRIGAEAVRAKERADEDDARFGERGVGANVFRDFDAEAALQIDVDDGEIGVRTGNERQRRLAALEHRHVKTEAAEMLREKCAERARLVGDDGNAAPFLRQRRLVESCGTAS